MAPFMQEAACVQITMFWRPGHLVSVLLISGGFCRSRRATAPKSPAPARAVGMLTAEASQAGQGGASTQEGASCYVSCCKQSVTVDA